MSIKDYQILENLGSGTYGQVNKVRRKKDGLVLVLKSVKLHGLSRKEQNETLNEATVMSKLSHPNIITYYESFIENENLNIVMSYSDDGDLGRKIENRSQIHYPFDESRIWEILLQVTKGLNYIHGKNILHRDIKSQNIFLEKNGSVKIGDFGLGRVLSSQSHFANTVVGTPLYFSPEVCEERKYDEKSDIWSFGVLLYEMCALEPPFIASNQIALANKIVHNDPKPIPSHYSNAIRFLIMKMLEKDPAKRPSTNQILKYQPVRDMIKEEILNEKEKELNKKMIEFEEKYKNQISKLEDELSKCKEEIKSEKKKNIQLIEKNELLNVQLKEKDEIIKKLKEEKEKEMNIERNNIHNNNKEIKNERKVKSDLVNRVIRRSKTSEPKNKYSSPSRIPTLKTNKTNTLKKVKTVSNNYNDTSIISNNSPSIIEDNNSNNISFNTTTTTTTTITPVTSAATTTKKMNKNRSIFVDGPLTPQQLSLLCEKVKRYENALSSGKKNNINENNKNDVIGNVKSVKGLNRRFNELLIAEADKMDSH